jgi:hypothetical protein
MTKAEMKTAVDDHVYPLNGHPHRLRLRSVATEPRFSRGRWYLLAIDLLPDGSKAATTTVHVMTRATVTRQELLDLIDDVVDEQMQRVRLEKGGNANEPSREVVA